MIHEILNTHYMEIIHDSAALLDDLNGFQRQAIYSKAINELIRQKDNWHTMKNGHKGICSILIDILREDYRVYTLRSNLGNWLPEFAIIERLHCIHFDDYWWPLIRDNSDERIIALGSMIASIPNSELTPDGAERN